MRYRSYKTAWVDKMKEDLFDPTQILVQIKGQINRVKIDYLLDDKRKEQKHECHPAEQIYHSTCWDHNLDDFRQISPFLLAIIAKQRFKVIDIRTQERVITYFKLPSPQTFIIPVPNFDAESRPLLIINTENGTATINLSNGQTCCFTSKPMHAVRCIGRIWDEDSTKKDLTSYVLCIKSHSGELVMQSLSLK